MGRSTSAWQRAAGATVAGMLAMPHAAGAEDFNLVTAKGSVSLGSFLNSSALKIRVNQFGSSDPVDPGFENAPFDWNESFGNPDVVRFRIDGLWRVSDRHHLRVMWTDYSAGREATLKQDVAWGDDFIEIGSSVRGRHGFSVAEVAYEYAFRRGDDLELALTAGLHYTSFTAKLTADILTPEGGFAGTLGGKASVDVPLPVFGGHLLWRIGGDLYLDGLAQWFALSIDEYDGGLVNYRGTLTWQPRRRLGIGLGYDYFKTDVDVSKQGFDGALDWSYSGPQLFLNVGF